MKLVFILFIALFSLTSNAQNLTQTVRGTVIDKFSKLPISNAEVNLTNAKSFLLTTDGAGEFVAEVALGRYTLMISHPKYNTFTQSDIIINSGKQVVLTIELDEKVGAKLNEVKITAKQKHKTLNEMTISSARQFVVDDANRYAGSLGDPARMAQNFAGVQSNGDSRNDIVIRGNSPLGLGWRLEGIEIPNPNHFSGVGNTGGAISILNNNNLSNSDFMTGAFAPQYGNAMAGIFDLRLRNGNNKQYEFMTQFGLNGLEFGAEGPLRKNSKASFIVNARYSTLEIFDYLGIKLPAAGQAKYRDLTFKVNVPTAKYGNLSIWGLGGYNLATALSKDYDTSGKRLNPRPKGFDTYFDNGMYAIGINHNINLSSRVVLTNIISANTAYNRTIVDSLYNNETQKFSWLGRRFNDGRINTHTQLAYKFNTQHQSQLGYYFTRLDINVNDSIFITWAGRYVNLLDYFGNTNLHRAYVQHQYRPNNNLTITGGIHTMLFTLNNSSAIEPRLAARYQISKKTSVNIGTGIHHQLQPFTTYFYNRTGIGNFVDSLTNKNLDFSKSAHIIVGADWNPLPNYRVKLDAYYQDLSQIAVQSWPTSYSVSNEGAFYYMIPKPFCINDGRGTNKGIELTVEKFFSKQYYFLITDSLYESRYLASDNIWRPTAFDGRWTLVTLGGYEFRVRKNNTLNVNLKFAALGGRPYTPVDTAASLIANQTVLDTTKAYTLRQPTYFRPDIRISYRLNRARISHEFGFNIDNFTNQQNVQSVEFDNVRKVVGFSYQNGRFPVVMYKAEWNYKRKNQ